MTAADILALDFDGVLCDGMAEYFETSRRTAAKVWLHLPLDSGGLRAQCPAHSRAGAVGAPGG